jgi:glycerophosphoryl diester phosphodiesterase
VGPMSAHPLLLGHRGAPNKGSIEGNSVAAFDRAVEHGCDGFEFDVRRTACGRAVISHDARFGRVKVSHALCGELRGLPRLEDIVRQYGQRAFLDIELKVKGLEGRVLAILRDHPPERDYVVSSFLPDVLLELKARSAVVPVGLICEKPRQLVAWRKLPLDYVIVHQSLVTRRLVHLFHGAGRKVLVWTVNSRRAMLQLASWRVDGIVSDRSELLVATLRRKSGDAEADAPAQKSHLL